MGHINFPAPEDHSACCWAHCPQSPPEKAHRQWEASPLCPTVGRLKAPGQVTCIISYRSTDVRLCTYSHSQAALVTSESSKIHISIFKIFISTLTEGYSTLCVSVDSGTSIWCSQKCSAVGRDYCSHFIYYKIGDYWDRANCSRPYI